ncbi:hypothetical protein ACLOJK_021153 [Asimina triloba]
MATEIKGNVVKVKSSQSQQIRGGSSSKEKGVVSSNNSSKTKIIKSATEKTASTSSKTTTKTATVKGKTEKKVYTLPGQKHDPPEEREPLRIFYESLSKQIPTSEMAEFWWLTGDSFDGELQNLAQSLKSTFLYDFWEANLQASFLVMEGASGILEMMEHGLLSPERAKRAYERKQKKQQQLRTGTPIKSPQKDRSESLQRKHPTKNGDLKAKKRMNYSYDDDDEFIDKLNKRERS